MGAVLGGLVGVFGLLALLTVGFAFVIGWLASSRLPPAEWWSKHPWRGFWIGVGGLLVSVVAYGLDLRASFVVLLGLSLFAIYGSCVWGLRVAWYRSRTRAVIIYVIGLGLVTVPGVERWIQRGRDPDDLDAAIMGVLFAAVFWVIAAHLADRFHRRIVARRAHTGAVRADEVASRL
jgi:hypothetical protein